jgi:uncharacterized protein (TIGR00288 family)
MPDSALTRSANIALLIDADNARADALDPVLTVLAELGTVNIRRAYGNWTKQNLKPWTSLVVAQGIEPQQQFDLTKGKNATDMKMTIDAMDLLYSGRVDGFGLMSSDSDFTPLAMRIRQNGLRVYGFGAATAPEGFRQACTRYIDVAALIQKDEPAPVPSPSRTGQPRVAKPPSSSEASPIDEALIKLLGDAWKAAKRDARGYARISDVGQRAGNRSSFDVRSYGFDSLADLFKAIPNFSVEQGDDGHMYVKRDR